MTHLQELKQLRRRVRKLRAVVVGLSRWQLQLEYERNTLGKITRDALAADDRYKEKRK